MPNEQLYLKSILKSIAKIERYLDGFDEQKFLEDERTQDAIIRQLEIIGEAARLLPDDLKTKYPELPWRSVSGMSNHLIHRYFRVDVEEVWRTAINDLGFLKKEVEKILENLA